MEERDYYWDTVFAQQRRWTDYELEKRSFIDDEYCSYLVTPQRRRKRLQQSVLDRRTADAASVAAVHQNTEEDLALQVYHTCCLNLVNGDLDKYNHELTTQQIPEFIILAKLLQSSQLSQPTTDDKEAASEGKAVTIDKSQAAGTTEAATATEGSQEKENVNTNKESTTKVDQVTYKPFELSDVPREELRRRLNKGEIAPRDEWIPTNDTTKKKSVSPAEAKERLGFAERLRSEALGHLETQRLEEAVTYFIQGCHLLEYYKCPSDEGLDERLQKELRRFRLNASRVSLKLQRFRDSISFVDDQLKDDPDDGVAMYLRGRSYEEAGDYDTAAKEYTALRKSPYATDEERQTGLIALHRLRKGYKQNSLKLKTMLEIYNQTLPDLELSTAEIQAADDYDDFGPHGDRETVSTPPTTDISPEHSAAKIMRPSSSPRRSSPDLCIHPVIADHQEMTNLLEALLKIYTSPSVTADLERIRLKADFDEKKTILALRKFLPTLLGPILVKYGYGTDADDYTMLKKKFDQDVLYHRHAPEAGEEERRQISSMVKDLHEVLVGTSLD